VLERGPDYLTVIRDQFVRWLGEKGYASSDEARGRAGAQLGAGPPRLGAAAVHAAARRLKAAALRHMNAGASST
jgi:hypothetical protein